MDYQEAIEYMRKELHKQCVNSEGQDAYIIAISAMKELREYKKLGTLEEVREAVEKQKRKKPCASNRCYVCPHCGLVASIKIKHNYCDACGQHIDWSEKE